MERSGKFKKARIRGMTGFVVWLDAKEEGEPEGPALPPGSCWREMGMGPEMRAELGAPRGAHRQVVSG